MQTLFPCEQAGTLFAKLVADETLRAQILKAPKATLADFGFDIDKNDLPQQPQLINNDAFENALYHIGYERQQKQNKKGALWVFVMTTN